LCSPLRLTVRILIIGWFDNGIAACGESAGYKLLVESSVDHVGEAPMRVVVRHAMVTYLKYMVTSYLARRHSQRRSKLLYRQIIAYSERLQQSERQIRTGLRIGRRVLVQV